MLHTKLSKTLISTTIALGFSWVACGWPIIASAQVFNPPSKGLPGRREGGGTRGPCLKETNPKLKNVTALIPQTNLGLTTIAYPTFFFYIPSTTAKTVQFELSDKDGNSIYKSTLDVKQSPSVIGVSLPKKPDTELQIDKDYNWSFTLVCDANELDANYNVEGWVQRVAVLPTSQLAKDLQGADSERSKAAIYAKNGIWFDSLITLADLLTTNPQDTTINKDWRVFLESVGLGEISRIETFSMPKEISRNNQ